MNWLRKSLLLLGLSLVLCKGTRKSKLRRRSTVKNYEPTGVYPTNFFLETVPKFVNIRPVIGVLTLGLDSPRNVLRDIPYAKKKAYLGSSYVKFLESAGAQVVPIPEDVDQDELADLLTKLNGVLLPGNDGENGDAGYYIKVKQILKYSKRLWKKKKMKFPVLGICRGAQRILIHVTGKDSQVDADAINMTLPISWRASDLKKSKLFGHAPSGLVRAMEDKPIAFFHSYFVVPTDTFFNNTKLMRVFRVLSTNVDRNGTKFVSTFEAKKYPWFGLQWQPEKAQFEFNPKLAVDHSINAIMASQYIANLFVSEARQNSNSFTNRYEENEYMITRDNPYFVGNVTDSEYDQIYLYAMKKDYGHTLETEKNIAPEEITDI